MNCVYVGEKTGKLCNNSRVLTNLPPGCPPICKKHAVSRWFLDSMKTTKEVVQGYIDLFEQAQHVPVQPEVQQVQVQAPPPDPSTIPIEREPSPVQVKEVKEVKEVKTNAKEWLDEVSSIELDHTASVDDIDSIYDELLKEEAPSSTVTRTTELKPRTKPSVNPRVEKKEAVLEDVLEEAHDGLPPAPSSSPVPEDLEPPPSETPSVAMPHSQLILKLGYRTLVYCAENMKPDLLTGLTNDVINCEPLDEVLNECAIEFETQLGLREADCWTKLAMITLALGGNRAAVNKSVGLGAKLPSLSEGLRATEKNAIPLPEEFGGL